MYRPWSALRHRDSRNQPQNKNCLSQLVAGRFRLPPFSLQIDGGMFLAFQVGCRNQNAPHRFVLRQPLDAGNAPPPLHCRTLRSVVVLRRRPCILISCDRRFGFSFDHEHPQSTVAKDFIDRRPLSTLVDYLSVFPVALTGTRRERDLSMCQYCGEWRLRGFGSDFKRAAEH